MLFNPNILLLSTDRTETVALRLVLDGHARLTSVDNSSELMTFLESDDYDALFCSWSFHTGAGHEVLDKVQALNPDLPVIVLSRTAEESEWIPALEAGAFDLLAPPFREQVLLGALEQASSCRGTRSRTRRSSAL